MKKLLLSITLMIAVSLSFAQNTQTLWSPVTKKEAISTPGDTAHIRNAKFFRLDVNNLKAALKNAPIIRTASAENSSTIISVPNADGVIERFKVVEAPVVEAGLAAKYPQIKTYRGQGIDNPSSEIGFTFSPYGFHAMIISDTRETFYIDPFDKNNIIYMAFSKKDAGIDLGNFKCHASEIAGSIAHQLSPRGNNVTTDVPDPVLKTFKFALTCTGEYAQAFLNPSLITHQDSINAVQAGMVAFVDRVNLIFEREVGIRLSLVNHNDRLIFLNPDKDYWDLSWPLDDPRYRSFTQHVIDSVTAITGDNYDLGHMVTAGDGSGWTSADQNTGFAGIVCKANKAEAYSSGHNPNNNPEIELVAAHEIAHQFSATHTFTYKNEPAAFMVSHMEPGKGTTIMSYAGVNDVTSPEVQPFRDDYFHAISIEQITNYLQNNSTCGVSTLTGNSIATAMAGIDYPIPGSTPFTLTATSTGGGATDVVTYNWEQYDTGDENKTFPSNGDTTGPLFRSRYYKTSPLRTFPILDDILSGQNFNEWEMLSAVTRQIHFRLTVRTYHPGGGNNTNDDMVVNVDGDSGPFKVTGLDGGAIFGAGTKQTITWDVAGSYAAPVNCTGVKISLSTNGGLTFPTVLKENTLNDGKEEVTLPEFNTTTARIKIEAVGNIFFDICDHDFTIGPSNDECVNAVTVKPVAGYSFNGTTGTLTNVTASSATDCDNKPTYDVWYKFTAEKAYHRIIIKNATTPDIVRFQLYSGDCSNLHSMACVLNSNDSTVYDAIKLVPGNEYYIKVYSRNLVVDPNSFTICINTPPLNIDENQNLLINGSFETPVQPGVNNEFNVGRTFNGWASLRNAGSFGIARVDITKPGAGSLGSPDSAEDGFQYLDFLGFNDTLYQDFTLNVATTLFFSGHFSNQLVSQFGYIGSTMYCGIEDVNRNLVAKSNIMKFDRSLSDKNWYQLSGSASLLAGDYKYIAFMGDYAVFDHAFVQKDVLAPTVSIAVTGESSSKIYANQKTVYIELVTETSGTVFIYNVVGKLVKTSKASKGLNKIDVPGTGVYLVRLLSGDNSLVKKVFIQ